MNKNWLPAFSVPLAIALVLSIIPAMTFADSDSLTPSVTIGNDDPNIIYMDSDLASYDPTEAGTTYVTLTINVSDENGADTLDDSSLTVEVDDAGTFATAVAKYTNSSCIVLSDPDANTRIYECTVSMDYWDSAGTYSTNISIEDTQGGSTFNDTASGAPTWAYTTLVASNVSTANITWATAVIGQSNQASDINPLVVTNRGNAQLKLNITGSDVVDGGSTITVGNFSVDLDNNAGNGEQNLTTSSAQISVDSQDATVAQGSDGTPSPTESVYFWADIPSGQNAGTYTGSWLLEEYEG